MLRVERVEEARRCARDPARSRRRRGGAPGERREPRSPPGSRPARARARRPGAALATPSRGPAIPTEASARGRRGADPPWLHPAARSWARRRRSCSRKAAGSSGAPGRNATATDRPGGPIFRNASTAAGPTRPAASSRALPRRLPVAHHELLPAIQVGGGVAAGLQHPLAGAHGLPVALGLGEGRGGQVEGDPVEEATSLRAGAGRQRQGPRMKHHRRGPQRARGERRRPLAVDPRRPEARAASPRSARAPRRPPPRPRARWLLRRPRR